jgi:MFS family permease
MFSRIALFVTAALAFAANPLADALGPVFGAILLVALGMALSLAASGAISAVAAAAGAVGAFAAGVLLPVSPAVAGAALVALCYAERSLRVRNPTARAVHVGMALIVGALAGAVAAHYAAAGITIRLVVAIVSAALVALPQLVEADDPLAYTLDGLAEEVSGAPAEAMRAGAELRRSVDEAMLEDDNRRNGKLTWRSLLKLAQARVRLERAGNPKRIRGAAVVERIDQRIAEHVSALERMYLAADTAKAAEASLDDCALRSVESDVISLEEMAEAIVEEV